MAPAYLRKQSAAFTWSTCASFLFSIVLLILCIWWHSEHRQAPPIEATCSLTFTKADERRQGAGTNSSQGGKNNFEINCRCSSLCRGVICDSDVHEDVIQQLGKLTRSASIQCFATDLAQLLLCFVAKRKVAGLIACCSGHTLMKTDCTNVMQ